jgi:hypothetical protein
MARGDFTLFEEFADELGEGVHTLGSDTVKLGIVDDTLTPTAADATPRWADYSANEVTTAGGYTANGETLTTVTYTEAAGVATFDSDAMSLTQDGSGFTDAYWAIMYNDSADADQAIGFIDLGGPVSEQAGDVTITPNASGWFTVTIT